MNKMVIKYGFVLFIFSGYCYAQDLSVDNPRRTFPDDNLNHNSVIKLQKDERLNVNDSKIDNPSRQISAELNEFSVLYSSHKRPNVVPAPNIVSSFRNNIHFGGFWDKYAIINFTPNMSLQPTDFINIFATHNTSVYVPIKGAFEYAKSLALQSAAIMAIDNSVKILLPPNNLVQGIVSFALKNAAMALIKSHTSESSLMEFKYYYYSISIRF